MRGSVVLGIAAVVLFGLSQVDAAVDCVCVPYYQCDSEGQVITDGTGSVDFRVKTCPGVVDVCCIPPVDGSSSIQPPTSPPTEPSVPLPPDPVEPPTRAPEPSNSNKWEVPKVSQGQGCGRRRTSNVNENFVDRIITTEKDTFYGEVPWIARILKPSNRGDNAQVQVCGGTLITRNLVLTAAHCVFNIPQGDLTLVFGDWDTSSTLEKLETQNRTATRVVLHPEFNENNLHNDIAVVQLDRDVTLSEVVDIACLAQSSDEVDSKNCFAAGWGAVEGSNHFALTNVLRKVSMPLLSHSSCQEKLRKTRVGKYFILHNNFLCAGGEPGRDTCRGDGGGPLYCPMKSDSNVYSQIGVTSWGIECGVGNPSVFSDVGKHLNWIKQQIRS